MYDIERAALFYKCDWKLKWCTRLLFCLRNVSGRLSPICFAAFLVDSTTVWDDRLKI